jgi:hypothetical protein
MMTVTDTTVDPRKTPEEVLDLLRAQIPLYVKLESQAARQRSLITRDDSSSLLSLLADRQRISADLARLGARLEPVRRDWESYRQAFTPVQREEADRMLAEIHEHIQRVIDIDEQDARLLAARKQAVADELRATHSASQAVSAYRASAGQSERLDRWDDSTR